MDAKRYLKQVEMLDAKIKNKMIERQQWENMAIGLSISVDGNRVQSTGKKEKMAKSVERCVDIEAEIEILVEELVKAKQDVIATIEKLESPTEYNILHKRYIQFIDLKDIAEIYDREYTWVTTTHGRALKNVQNLLNL